MTLLTHTLFVYRNESKLTLPLDANGTAHAQAQAIDIGRALNATKTKLDYTETKETPLAQLFKDLAFNNYDYKTCVPWTGSYTNAVPCVYALKKRYYIRNLIVRYLDIPNEDCLPKPSCGCKNCVNPLHFEYRQGKNSKLTCGGTSLLLAYASQGVSPKQIAKVLKVHPSTVYRNLNHERLFIGPPHHSRSTR